MRQGSLGSLFTSTARLPRGCLSRMNNSLFRVEFEASAARIACKRDNTMMRIIFVTVCFPSKLKLRCETTEYLTTTVEHLENWSPSSIRPAYCREGVRDDRWPASGRVGFCRYTVGFSPPRLLGTVCTISCFSRKKFSRKYSYLAVGFSFRSVVI